MGNYFTTIKATTPNYYDEDLGEAYPPDNIFRSYKPHLKMPLKKYNELVTKEINNNDLTESEISDMEDFKQNFCSNYYGIGLYDNDKIQDKSPSILIPFTKDMYNKNVEDVQKGYILPRVVQNQMHSFYHKYHQEKDDIYAKSKGESRGGIWQVIRYAPSCLTDNPTRISNDTKFICWACYVRHDNGKLE